MRIYTDIFPFCNMINILTDYGKYSDTDPSHRYEDLEHGESLNVEDTTIMPTYIEDSLTEL